MALVSPVSNSHLPLSPSHQQTSSPSPNPSGRQQIPVPVSADQSQSHQTAPLFLEFNQDYGRFACGTNLGFRVYDCDPFKEAFRREPNNGGIGIVELLFRSNILALVGGGDNPRYPPNKVMIWDDCQVRCIGELSFRTTVRAVKLRRDRIVVALEQKVYVYNFADLKLLSQIETVANPRGLCALSSTSNSAVLACPGIQRGQVRIEHYGLKKIKFISAHDSHLACLVLTLDGRLLATASNKGTLIRVFNTLDGTRLQELRRGVDRAEIYSIAFSVNAQWLAVSSDKGTVHVFGLKATEEGRTSDEGQDERRFSNQSSSNGSSNVNGMGSTTGSSMPSTVNNSNPGSTFSFMRGVLPRYFSSEWSFSQFRLSEENKSIVAFGPQKDTIMIVASDGSFYKCAVDPAHGGEMTQLEYIKFIKPGIEESA